MQIGRQIRLLGLAVVVLASAALGQTDGGPTRIKLPIDETHCAVLKGNIHPSARPEFDLGTAPANLPMECMLLVLRRTQEQESGLRKLLDDQQTRTSAN